MDLPATIAERTARLKELEAAVLLADDNRRAFREAWAADCGIKVGDIVDYVEYEKPKRLLVKTVSVSLVGVYSDRPTIHVYGRVIKKDGTVGLIRGSFHRAIK